jgi:two-component system, NarL family, nitrate/nitrite response regulator NarL
MRTLIVDDHPLFSDGLRLLLMASTSIEDVVCCEDGEAALRLAADGGFELVLLDWNLGSGLSGAPLVREIKAVLPDARVVVVSGENSAAHVRLAIESGAVGFVPKESPSALLIDALTITAHRGIYLPAEVLMATERPARGAPLRGAAEAYPRLTERQVEVLESLVTGLTNKQIARRLDIAENTVKQHLNAIFSVLGVQNRTEAVYLLSKNGVRFD